MMIGEVEQSKDKTITIVFWCVYGVVESEF